MIAIEEPSAGLVLHSPGGTRYLFDPGALCLELLTTGGPGDYARYEVLHEPGDLAEWLRQSRLRLPAADGAGSGPGTGAGPGSGSGSGSGSGAAGIGISPGQLAAVRTLRDALWRLTAARAHGEAGAAEDYAVLNRAAAHPPLVPQIALDGAAAPPLPADGDQLASTLARDAIALLTGPYADRIRECGAHDCSLLFVDTSRPGRRRWCSMERCGNRHKVRALRARRDRTDGPAGPAGQNAPTEE
ncbi:CGNR zinc finger domain-containing protein [Kitasatospora sp. NPDC047058]|uniref:CGNR zinc finger domain-containing protein n=1 Tax=Kitasatospora sp. NPDC047058 TaxID=3155620 RepID=UPI00340FCCF6